MAWNPANSSEQGRNGVSGFGWEYAQYLHPQLEKSAVHPVKLGQLLGILHSSALGSIRRWCFNLVMSFLYSVLLPCLQMTFDSVLFVLSEIRLCGFRWFSVNVAAKVDGIQPVLWQAFHLGLMVSSVTLAKPSPAFWRAGPLVKVTQHLLAHLCASSWQGEMQLALCNNWYICKAGREEEWKSSLNIFFSNWVDLGLGNACAPVWMACDSC